MTELSELPDIEFVEQGQNQANVCSTCTYYTYTGVLSTRICFFLKLNKKWQSYEPKRCVQIWARAPNFIVLGL